MRYWLNKNRSIYNVVILARESLNIGSIDKEDFEKAEKKITQGIDPFELIGKKNKIIIPYTEIKNVLSKGTEDRLKIKFPGEYEVEDRYIDFDSAKSSNECLLALEKYLPDNLIKKEYTESRFLAINTLVSLFLCFYLSSLFFNSFKILTAIIGGFWALIELHTLYQRLFKPNTVVHWSEKGLYKKKAWSGIKSLALFCFTGVFTLFAYNTYYNEYGEASLYSNLQEAGTNANKSIVEKYLSRGADINYKSLTPWPWEKVEHDRQPRDTALALVISHKNNELAKTLIENGADVNIKYARNNMLEYAIKNEASIEVLTMILDRIDIDEVSINGSTISDYVKALSEDNSEEQKALITLLESYIEN